MTHEICSDTPKGLNFIPKMQTKEEINPYAVKMFETDFSERHSTEQSLSQDKFLTIVEDGIHHCESGHYKMPLPLKHPSPPLLKNREVALRRLSQLKRRFESNKKYKEDYVAFMESMIQSGYAERVLSKGCLIRKDTKNCQLNPGDDSKNQGSSHQRQEDMVHPTPWGVPPQEAEQNLRCFRPLFRVQGRNLKQSSFTRSRFDQQLSGCPPQIQTRACSFHV